MGPAVSHSILSPMLTSKNLEETPDEANDTQKLSDGDYDTTPNLMTPDSEDRTDNKCDQSEAMAATRTDATTSDIDITKLYFDKKDDADTRNSDNDVDITQLYFDKVKHSRTNDRKRQNKSKTRMNKKKRRTTKEKEEKTRNHKINTRAGIRRRVKATGTSNG